VSLLCGKFLEVKVKHKINSSEVSKWGAISFKVRTVNEGLLL
jgi:hypothetical protein